MDLAAFLFVNMNPAPSYDPAILDGLYAFMANQLARIHNQLYPDTTNPRHVRGPRRPDLQQIESKMRP